MPPGEREARCVPELSPVENPRASRLRTPRFCVQGTVLGARCAATDQTDQTSVCPRRAHILVGCRDRTHSHYGNIYGRGGGCSVRHGREDPVEKTEVEHKCEGGGDRPWAHVAGSLPHGRDRDINASGGCVPGVLEEGDRTVWLDLSKTCDSEIAEVRGREDASAALVLPEPSCEREEHCRR